MLEPVLGINLLKSAIEISEESFPVLKAIIH
jgi:hypothetical protein